MTVYDEDGTELGAYFADLLVEGELVIELKAVRTTSAEHIAQLLGYLKSSRKEHGLLINFGSYRFQIKKYAMSRDGRGGGCGSGGMVTSLLFGAASMLATFWR